MKSRENQSVFCVETIKLTDEPTVYMFPVDLQSADHHEELFNAPVMKNACKSLKKVGQFRNVKLIITEPFTTRYIDAAGNFIFGDALLEEMCLSFSPEDETTPSVAGLLNILKHFNIQESSKEPKWNDIEKRFAIDKFSGKEKSEDWLASFEAECVRHNLKDDTQRIKCLKLFLVDNALDWYKSTLIRLKDENWNEWSATFKKVYSDKGWAKVRQAYNFKYLSGAFVDYALKKERLILEVESRTTEYAVINQIVIGLPIFIQDKLDREKLKTTQDLMNKLRQFESGVTKRVPKLESNRAFVEPPKTKSDPKNQYDRNPVRYFERKPCAICNAKGYPGRFHSADRCRNRDGRAENFRININEESDGNSSDETDQKN